LKRHAATGKGKKKSEPSQRPWAQIFRQMNRLIENPNKTEWNRSKKTNKKPTFIIRNFPKNHENGAGEEEEAYTYQASEKRKFTQKQPKKN